MAMVIFEIDNDHLKAITCKCEQITAAIRKADFELTDSLSLEIISQFASPSICLSSSSWESFIARIKSNHPEISCSDLLINPKDLKVIASLKPEADSRQIFEFYSNAARTKHWILQLSDPR
jgi:hypothetical protein